MTLLQEKQLTDITWADIEALVGLEESLSLEFKGGDGYDGKPGFENRLPAEDTRRGKMRDIAAKAAVAFANAYGGTLVIGVSEGDGQTPPFRATGLSPIRDVHSRAMALEQAVKDSIDPPVPGLTFHVMTDPSDASAGIILVRVPRSSVAPHGIGKPAAAYRRDGGVSQPMTMRDLQSSFWDARTRRERVVIVRQKAEERFQRWRSKHKSIETPSGVYGRMTAIFPDRLSLPKIPLQRHSFIRPDHCQNASAFGQGSFSSYPKLMAHGLFYEEDDVLTVFRDDGSINVMGFQRGYNNHPDVEVNGQFAGWYVESALLTLKMADSLRRVTSIPEAIFEFDINLQPTNTIRSIPPNNTFGRQFDLPDFDGEIDTFLIGPHNEFKQAFRQIETVIWNAFGAQPLPLAEVKLDAFLSQTWSATG